MFDPLTLVLALLLFSGACFFAGLQAGAARERRVWQRQQQLARRRHDYLRSLVDKRTTEDLPDLAKWVDETRPANRRGGEGEWPW